MDIFWEFLKTTGFVSMTLGNLIMIVIGIVFIALAIMKDYEPLLLVPIGMGAIVGNIPVIPGMSLSVYDAHHWVIDENGEVQYIAGSVSELSLFRCQPGHLSTADLSRHRRDDRFFDDAFQPQVGVARRRGSGRRVPDVSRRVVLEFFVPAGRCDRDHRWSRRANGDFPCRQTGSELLGAIAIAAYSYMALVPVIQPPIMRLLTTREERLIRMAPPRKVSKREKMIFPVAAFLISTLIAPGAIVLLGMLFFGNLLKESMVTERLARTARTAMIDIVTILLGFAVGASTQAETFLTRQSLMIFGLGALSFAIATAGGVLFAKFMNLFLTEKINPLIGAAGVSAVPDSARVVQMVGQQEDPHNFLLMHAMAPNVAGVVGSAIAAGVLWAVLT